MAHAEQLQFEQAAELRNQISALARVLQDQQGLDFTVGFVDRVVRPSDLRVAARNLEQVIAEVAAARLTERGATRADDRFTEAAMEDRKREGYF